VVTPRQAENGFPETAGESNHHAASDRMNDDRSCGQIDATRESNCENTFVASGPGMAKRCHQNQDRRGARVCSEAVSTTSLQWRNAQSGVQTAPEAHAHGGRRATGAAELPDPKLALCVA